LFRSIRWRIAIPYVLLIVISMVGLGIYLSGYIFDQQLSQLENQLASETRLLAEGLIPYLEQEQRPSDRLPDLARQWGQLIEARVTIIAPDGRVLADSDEDYRQMENHIHRPEVIDALATGIGSSIRFSQTLGYRMIYTAVVIQPAGEPLGIARVAVPVIELERSVNRLQRALAGFTALTALISVVIATLIATRTTRPLRHLTQAAEQFFGGSTPGRQAPAGSDEIGKLTQAFNLMSVQIRTQIEALESERSKMAAVLSEMTDGVIIVDQQGYVQLINPAARAMFEVQNKEAVGHSLVETLRIHQLVELWQQCLKSGQPQIATLELSSRNLYLQGVATPLGESLPGNILMLFQNLTRLRRLETIRRDFISNISHELRTPLASLKALTETLQEGALDDPPAARRFLERMETEVDALSLMVSELLELSRIESGQVPLKLNSVSPCRLLSEAVDRLRLQAERSGLDVQVACREGDLPEVLADAGRLEQVLVNLLHNAIKFTPRGGQITVSAQPFPPDNEQVQFSVQDTGIGIPAKDLSRIFERFYKTDRARSSGGTGLGLAIARHMVEAHGGRLWADSREGQGSTFFFTIPVAGI
jgi:two-component system, OmpR family, phosphate regulon sensor histidine kinase PhoR